MTSYIKNFLFPTKPVINFTFNRGGREIVERSTLYYAMYIFSHRHDAIIASVLIGENASTIVQDALLQASAFG